MELILSHADELYTLTINIHDNKFNVKIKEKEYHVSQVEFHANMLTFILNDQLRTAYYMKTRDAIYVNIEGTSYVFSRESSSVSRYRHAGTTEGDSVMSPMPGLIVKITVNLGDEVLEGAILAIVEAMKMQNELRAPRKGVVKKINFKEGEQVDALQPIVELEKA